MCYPATHIEFIGDHWSMGWHRELSPERLGKCFFIWVASRQPLRPHLVHKRMLVHHLLLTKYLERIPRQYTEPKSAERVRVRLYYRKHNAVAAVHAGLPEGFRQLGTGVKT